MESFGTPCDICRLPPSIHHPIGEGFLCDRCFQDVENRDCVAELMHQRMMNSIGPHIHEVFVSSISVHIYIWTGKPWPAQKLATGLLEALHAKCACWTRAFLCAAFVIDWLHLNNNTYDSIIQDCRSFAMIACRTSLMSVTGVGGKKSFIITSYLLTQRSKAAFRRTYGLPLEISHACAATAIRSGSHVKGDVGDALWSWIRLVMQ